MENLRRILISMALPVAVIVIVSSCKRDDDPFSDYTYLRSAENLFTTSAASVTSLLSLMTVSDPEASELMQFVNHDVDIYRITYSTMLYDENITASGLICVPVTPGSYPALSFQNGTNTLHSNAPSVNPSNFSYQLVENVASMGFIVIIPDYPGFGSSEQKAHPYLLKEPTVKSVTDMLGALEEFVGDVVVNTGLTGELFLFGYSQGGWATLALHREVEEKGAHGFNLAASAAGAGPADLRGMLEGFVAESEYPVPAYFGYIAHAYNTYERFSLPYSAIFNEPYASRVPTLFNGTLSLGNINSMLTTDIAALLDSDFKSGFASDPAYASVRQALEDNSIPAWNTSVPLLLVHGEADTQVPAAGTVVLYNEMISEGSSPQTVRIELIPDADHGDGLIPASVKSLLFMLEFIDRR
ncbi:MAG: alpha/beta fold hydrolase [Bacteroidales bacterium]